MQAYFKQKPLNPKPIELDDSLSFEEGTLSVTNPTHPDILTQEEFNALSEEQRNAGIYVVENGEEEDLSSYDTVYVQSYDTPDGWHVRKHSDGYVEMYRTVSRSNMEWWTTGSRAYTGVFKSGTFPIPLTQKYCDEAYIADADENTAILLWIARTNAEFGSLSNSAGYFVIASRSGVNILSITHHITGRWK